MTEGHASAVLAASIFHFGPVHAIAEVKDALRAAGHEVLSTGRLHHGHRFRTDDALARTLENQIRDMPAEMEQAAQQMGALGSIMRTMAGTAFGLQIGQAIGELAPKAFDHVISEARPT